MPSYGGFELQSQKDALLIYEVGSTTQKLFIPEQHATPQNHVSCFRLNKTLSLILRHWEWLRRNNKTYEDLNEWGIFHFPYIYGQRIYKPVPSNDWIPYFPDGVIYVEHLIELDVILKRLRVRVAQSEENTDGDDYEKTPFFFPGSGAIEKSVFWASIRLDPRDSSLVRQLAELLGPQSTKDICALATCPTEEDCLTALAAQINLWLRNIDQLETYINPNNFTAYANVQRVQDKIKYAFRCGEQMKYEREFLSQSPGAAHRIYSYAIDRGYEAREIEPLMHIIDGQTQSDRVDVLMSLADIMSALIGFVAELLDRANVSSGLSAGNAQWADKHYYVLSKIGISESDIRRSRTLPHNTKWDYRLDIARDIVGYFGQMRTYLADRKLPSTYQLSALLNPRLILKEWTGE